MATKRKTTTTIVAGVTAAALLLGGTFAWTSISQQALNETAGVVNVGGRLHDDFDGTNKDVYVENFTDPLDGGQPIYARIKLTEYMEVGQDAGGFGKDVNNDGKTTAVPVIPGTSIDNEDGWKIFIPGSITDDAITCKDCGDGTTAATGACGIHNHWKWDVAGNTIFMPTFNKDKDSLAADINGTYAGTNADDKIYYDDYVTYVTADGVVVDVTNGTVDGTEVTIPAVKPGANALTEANKDVTTVTGNAQYDNDPDGDPNTTANDDYILKPETHTAKQTATATVMTMQAWIDAGSLPGNYWVYDTDGWAYWANPIMPGEATGLLLDGIEMYQNPGEKCYYAINVVGQFATVNDWEYFDNWDPESNAAKVMAAAVSNVTTVTVTNNGATTLSAVVDEEAGTTNTTTFTATASKPSDSTATVADPEFTWAVYDADLNPVDTSTITVGDDGTVTLTVGENEKNANLIIAATHVESGAVGLSSVAIDNPVVVYRLAVSSNSTDEYTTYEDCGYVNLDSNYTVTLTANDKPLTISEVVSVTVVNSYNMNNDTLNTFAGSTTLQDDGTVLLTVGTESDELGTGSYAYTYWKIIKLTVKDSEGTEYSRNLLLSNDTLSYSEMIYRHMDGTLATQISTYYVVNNLTINTMYTFAPGLYSQSNGTMSQYLDPVWFDDGWTVTAYEYDTETYETGAVATSVTIKDNTIIFAEAGEYVIEAVKEGYETVRSNVTVTDPYAFINEIPNITPGSTDTVTIDGMEWYVLAKNETANTALLFSKDSLDARQFDTDSNTWNGSDMQLYLNGEWLDDHSVLKQNAVLTNIPTYTEVDGEYEITYSDDTIFLLSGADLLGDYGEGDYTYDTAFDITNFEVGFYWLRSACETSIESGKYVAVANIQVDELTSQKEAISSSQPYDSADGIRICPALWISLDPNYSEPTN